LQVEEDKVNVALLETLNLSLSLSLALSPAFVGTAVAQLFLLGITWIFGIVHFIRASTTIAYLFIITNVFQGASIFIFHCLLNNFVCRSQRAKAQSTSVQVRASECDPQGEISTQGVGQNPSRPSTALPLPYFCH
uniref:G-protein coupled receptors family 2 profile 2 domain-containing protein n=1 Tax=Callorhinchus milii TaxID=7868 RepID=A0A4W3H3R7_CALMI